MAIALASLCSRASAAESGSDTSAQRSAGLRLTAIEMPMPLPQIAIRRVEQPQVGRREQAVDVILLLCADRRQRT